MNNNQERIVCAAIHYMDLPTMTYPPVNITKGVVVCGLRHPHCIYTVKALANLRTVTFATDGVGEFEQGFLTSKNRFVDRKEGASIALAANQIINMDRFNPNQLYSEDLY